MVAVGNNSALLQVMTEAIIDFIWRHPVRVSWSIETYEALLNKIRDTKWHHRTDSS